MPPQNNSSPPFQSGFSADAIQISYPALLEEILYSFSRSRSVRSSSQICQLILGMQRSQDAEERRHFKSLTGCEIQTGQNPPGPCTDMVGSTLTLNVRILAIVIIIANIAWCIDFCFCAHYRAKQTALVELNMFAKEAQDVLAYIHCTVLKPNPAWLTRRKSHASKFPEFTYSPYKRIFPYARLYSTACHVSVAASDILQLICRPAMGADPSD